MQLLATAILVASLAISVKCSVLDLEKRQGCNRGYTLCRPDGAKELGVKTAPNDLENLYINLLDAVKSVPQAPNRKRDIQIEQRDAESGSSPDLCCPENLNCLLLKDASAPFCYDRFTTNYRFPDGTSGSLVTGDFNGQDGVKANLVNGVYTGPDGKQQNIYSTIAPPNTATLVVPSPFTAAGVGSAIPITALGGVVTYATTVPGTTVAPSTGISTTKPGTTILERVTTITTTVSGSVAAAAVSTSSTAGGASPTNRAGAGAAGAIIAGILAVL